MTLFRGLGDDKVLHDWLAEDIWPMEKKFVGPEFVRAGMTHAVAEMIRSGTTCFNNMYFFPDEICGVLERTGMRGAVGQGIMDMASPYGTGPDDFLAKAEPNLKKYAPDATTSSQSPWRPIRRIQWYNARIHIHLHETEAECNDSEQLNRASMCCHKSNQKLRPLANFKRLGLLSERLICAHMTQLTDEEIDDVARAGAHQQLTDMLGEMKLAALLAKAESRNSTSVSAAEALQMATLNGARALGLEHEIGSIEVGKHADLIALECDSIEMLPMYNAVSHMVYVAGREHVSDVWINGKQVLRSHELTTVDEAEVKREVREWTEHIRSYHNEVHMKRC
ncbi:Metal-dependent hydrolase [Phytophthora cactorum]|nr:Metal-dependent hydrolase [Phytophthora cactorum]